MKLFIFICNKDLWIFINHTFPLYPYILSNSYNNKIYCQKNYITMDNIEIKRTPNKRNMDSLLEESAIDNTFNY
mgnify:CR=1 FL=1